MDESQKETDAANARVLAFGRVVSRSRCLDSRNSGSEAMRVLSGMAALFVDLSVSMHRRVVIGRRRLARFQNEARRNGRTQGP